MSSLADFFTVPPDGSCSCVVRDREQTAGGITTEGPTRRRPKGHRQGDQLSAGREAYCPPTRRLARPWSPGPPDDHQHLRRDLGADVRNAPLRAVAGRIEQSAKNVLRRRAAQVFVVA